MNAKKYDFIDFSIRIGTIIFINYFIVRLIIASIEINISFSIIINIFITTFLSVLLFLLISRKPITLIWILLINIIFIVYMNNFQKELYIDILFRISDFFTWSSRFIRGDTFNIENYAMILILLFTFLISLINYTFVFNTIKTFPLLLWTMFFMYKWFLYMDESIIYFFFYIMFVLILHTYNQYTIYNNTWNQKAILIEKGIRKIWITYSLIVCCLVLAIAFIFPKNFSPITWRWLDKSAQEVFPELTEWRNSKKKSQEYGNTIKFNLTYTDYQKENRRLGGPIKPRNILVMRVKSDSSEYLKGRVCDYYTGTYWKDTDDLVNSYIKNQPISIISQNIKGRKKSLVIEHINLSTSTIFTSNIPTRIVSDYNYYVTDEFELYGERLIMNNEKYRVYFIKPYIDYEKIRNINYNINPEFAKYLQIPAILPQRVRDLSQKITKHIHSDYDKINALKNYLKTEFSYSLTPSETPYNRDFVDYFLFDLKEGYCTYFASALTLMSRSIGIPARYVEGFKMPDESENNIYNVYSNNAHAWVEIYIEGYGWIVFEPTPGFGGENYSQNYEQIDNEVLQTDISTVGRQQIDLS